jgi:uncharacterized protein YecE (DUF72 family)
MSNNKYFSGTSGLQLPFPNKQFYPADYRDKSRLFYYGSLFNSIEINSSFYKIPMAATVQKWAESVPEDFRFTFKLWKEITHSKGLVFDAAAVHRFMETINHVGSKKGCLLVQFPPSVTVKYIMPIRHLFSEINHANPGNAWKVAVEFRHPSWYEEDLEELFISDPYGLVLHDKGQSTTPLTAIFSDFVYLRFHGPGGNYKGSYPSDILAEYAEYISDWIMDEKTVYVYFNNTMGDAIANLQDLNKLIHPL